ncbi:MAG: hypothetical protein JWP30_521 [Homoserinimonas sp.]|jgi:hypothetical protein|nr:hypothetical protein [Mycetocola sp.]MCU1545421.1 hypothetical protein [Homoserinimonas sp.]
MATACVVAVPQTAGVLRFRGAAGVYGGQEYLQSRSVDYAETKNVLRGR